MKLNEVVVNFPTKKRANAVRKDRARRQRAALARRGMRYDEITGMEVPALDGDTEEYHVVNQDGASHAIFDNEPDARKAIPRLEIKSGKRGLYVIKF